MKSEQQNHSIFYHTGRGVFVALALFAMPSLVVVRFYPQLEAWYTGVAELPVFEKMQHTFRTGVAVAGASFLRETTRYYDLDTVPDPSERLEPELVETDFHLPETRDEQRFWLRQDIENQLFKTLPTSKQPAVGKFLDYVETHRELAISEMRRSKIPASVILAQGLLESNAGRSFLAKKANNHFGVKCRQRPGARRDGRLEDSDFGSHSLAVDCVQRADDNAWDRFEVYESTAASFRRHSLLLLGERYNWMIRAYRIGEICPLPRKLYGQTEAPYYAAWCLGLKLSGYATSKFYAEKLTLIIETYQLWKIDYEAFRLTVDG